MREAVPRINCLLIEVKSLCTEKIGNRLSERGELIIENSVMFMEELDDDQDAHTVQTANMEEKKTAVQDRKREIKVNPIQKSNRLGHKKPTMNKEREE
ncbi:hypothetical protein Q1695_007001 [Nippostrongylus brasiliensis]|nr:hypothetical protein Q1695_007001 [Nippostrongylus brasiliensis]